jgi:hypothetical protein
MVSSLVGSCAFLEMGLPMILDSYTMPRCKNRRSHEG